MKKSRFTNEQVPFALNRRAQERRLKQIDRFPRRIRKAYRHQARWPDQIQMPAFDIDTKTKVGLLILCAGNAPII